MTPAGAAHHDDPGQTCGRRPAFFGRLHLPKARDGRREDALPLDWTDRDRTNCSRCQYT